MRRLSNVSLALTMLLILLGGSLGYVINLYKQRSFQSEGFRQRWSWIEKSWYGVMGCTSLMVLVYSYVLSFPERLVSEEWMWWSQLLVVLSLLVQSLLWMTLPPQEWEAELAQERATLTMVRGVAYTIFALCVGWTSWEMWRYVQRYREQRVLVPLSEGETTAVPFLSSQMQTVEYIYKPELSEQLSDEFAYLKEQYPTRRMEKVSEQSRWDSLATHMLTKDGGEEYYVEVIPGKRPHQWTSFLEYDRWVESLVRAFREPLNNPKYQDTQQWEFERSDTGSLLSMYQLKTVSAFAQDACRHAGNLRTSHSTSTSVVLEVCPETVSADQLTRIQSRTIDYLARHGVAREDDQYLMMALWQQGALRDLWAMSGLLFFPPSVFPVYNSSSGLFVLPLRQTDATLYPKHLRSVIKKECHTVPQLHSQFEVSQTYYPSFSFYTSALNMDQMYPGLAIIEAMVYVDIDLRHLHRFYRIYKWANDNIRRLVIAIYNVGGTTHQALEDTLLLMLTMVCQKKMFEELERSWQDHLVRRYVHILTEYDSQHQLAQVKQVHQRVPSELRPVFYTDFMQEHPHLHIK